MEKIGRYQILGELGRGAMGVVYRAQDPAIGRTIAVKTIRLSDLTEPGERDRLRERLMREAQSAGILSHPNIVTIYDILEENGLAHIFMEFVSGAPLEKLLEGDAAPDKATLLSILRQTASALDYAHKKGIVHRDIKPANIMIHEDRMAKITDFGVAKILSQQMTQSGTMMGTPSYMSPEQVQGSDVTGRADQFALAVIAYEMLTGERPFVADYLPSLLYKICREEPVPAQRLNTTLAPEVDAVLRRALSKQPENRYPTCGDFVDELERACDLRSDWVPLARGTSLNLPTMVAQRSGAFVSTDRSASTDNVQTVADLRGYPRTASPGFTTSHGGTTVPPPAAVAHPPLPEPAYQAREPVRLEDTESHTVRNVVLALASIVVIGLIVLLAQQWFAPRPSPVAAEKLPEAPAAVSNATKPSPAPAVPRAAEPPPPAPQQQNADRAEPEEEAPARKTQEAPKGEESRKATVTRPALPARTPQAVDVPVQIIASPPGAQILVDGAQRCTAPCSLSLVPGRHTLLARADGYRDLNKIFELPSEANLSLDMDRKGGTLSISSNPTGSTIYINGQQRPEKTPAILTLPVGTYQIHLANGRFQCDADQVHIQDGSMSQRRCDMQ